MHAKKNDITFVCLPPNASNKMQLLDIAMFTGKVAESENLKTVPVSVPTYYLNTVPVPAPVPVPVPAPVPSQVHTYTFTNTYTYMCTYSQTYTYTHTETYTVLIQYIYIYRVGRSIVDYFLRTPCRRHWGL